MILVGATDTSLSYRRPAPVFCTEERPLSTKKSRGTPKFAAPPKAPVKSCPVTRIFSRVSDTDRPQPVSFRDDSDTSFILQSSVYSAAKPALYFEQCYEIEERLGCGSFGEVFRVRSKEDGQLYACKKSLLKFRGEGDRRRRMQEVQKHETLPKHRNCVEFYRAWEERQQLYLLTEVCRTSLAQVAETKHDLPEHTIWEYLVDLLQGVNHLHKNNLVHMDIKPENIFFGYDGLCKLGDFGLVIDISQGPVHEAAEGDPKYLAPEVMKQQFGPPADIFSLGMTILELATDLDLPKQGEAWQKLRQGSLPPAASKLSEELQSVLLGLLNPNPQERLTADQALALTPIRRVQRYKTVKDYCWQSVERARRAMAITWVYLAVFLASLARPITTRFYPRPHNMPLNDSHRAHSPMNHSDSDFTLGFSDEEDDHSLAHPLGDISSSSSEIIVGKRCANSTPIGFKYVRHQDLFTTSPVTRSSLCESQDLVDSPSLFRSRTPLSRSHRKLGNQKNGSQVKRSSFNTSSPKNTVDEEPQPAVNLTSRNLIDLFNAAESDDEY